MGYMKDLDIKRKNEEKEKYLREKLEEEYWQDLKAEHETEEDGNDD